jgi:hypothetical protein
VKISKNVNEIVCKENIQLCFPPLEIAYNGREIAFRIFFGYAVRRPPGSGGKVDDKNGPESDQIPDQVRRIIDRWQPKNEARQNTKKMSDRHLPKNSDFE